MWVDVKNWENLYEVNDCGDIRNKQKGNLLVGDKNSIGYERVCLYNINHVPRKQRFFRHRLVAEHFIPNPDKLPEVNHKDTNIKHNFKENLEWCTKKENELHSRIRGSKEYKPFKTTFNNGEIKVYHVAGELADEIGVTAGCVRHWLKGFNGGYEKYDIKNIEYI